MNIEKLLGATTPVEVAHGELDGQGVTVILHAKLDAAARRNREDYAALEAAETAARERVDAALAGLDMKDAQLLTGDQQLALLDYLKTLHDALLEPEADRAALRAEHEAALVGFADRLRVTPKQIEAHRARVRKAVDAARAEAVALAGDLLKARAARLCFLVARAEIKIGDGAPEALAGWGPEAVGEFSADTLDEWLDAVEKKALARWRNR